MQRAMGCCGTMVFGTVFVSVGIGVMLVASKLYTFDCERLNPPSNQGQCEWVAQGLLGSDRSTLPIETLEDADVEESRNSDEGTTYRVVIRTTEGTFPLSNSYSSGRSGKDDITSEIRSFITTETQATLSVQQDDRWFGYLFGGIFGGVGALMILGAPLAMLFRQA